MRRGRRGLVQAMKPTRPAHMCNGEYSCGAPAHICAPVSRIGAQLICAVYRSRPIKLGVLSDLPIF
jgi:hypothetical protein